VIDNVDDALEEQRRQQEEQAAIARGHELRSIIDFGLQVEQFLDTEIGKRLLRDATEERLRLTESYILLNPDIPKEREQMSDIRFRVHVLNAWQEFFEQYIRAGNAAQEQFRTAEIPD